MVKDDEGMDLADMAEVKSEAIESARDLLADAIRSGEEFDYTKAFVITDEQDSHLMSVPFTEALPKQLKRATVGKIQRAVS